MICRRIQQVRIRGRSTVSRMTPRTERVSGVGRGQQEQARHRQESVVERWESTRDRIWRAIGHDVLGGQ